MNLILGGEIVARESLEMEMVRGRCATTGAVVYQDKMGSHSLGQTEDRLAVGAQILGKMTPVDDDQMKIEDGGHITQYEIVILIDQALLFRVEILRAEEAGPVHDRVRVDTSRNAGHSVRGVLTENPTPLKVHPSPLGLTQCVVSIPKLRPIPLLLLVEGHHPEG
jgi:hypothetical protein